MAARLQLTLRLGLSVALGETVAALSMWNRDPAFLLLQAAVAFTAAALLFLVPLPARVLAVLPVVGAGGFHGARVLGEGGNGLGLPGLAAVGFGALAVGAVLWILLGPAPQGEERRAWVRRATEIVGAAYVLQALWCARLLIPVTLGPFGTKAATALVALGLVPLVVAWATPHLPGRGERAATRLGRVVAFALPIAVLAPPALGYWPWMWHAHRQSEGPEGPLPRGPDVLLIVLDTVRADRLGLYGYPRATTPRLSAFAEGATVYRKAQSQGIWTLPGHASIFTGLYPTEHGADWLKRGKNARGLTREAVTLAERFRLEGYQTGAVVSNKALFGSDFGLTQGFDTAWAELGSSAQLIVPFVVSELVHTLYGQSARQRIGALEQNQFAPATEINRLALDWLERSEPGRPSFLFVNTMEAHGQLRREPCPAPLFGDGRPFGEWDIPNVEEVQAGRADADPALLERFGDWYDSQVACADQHLGELFDELRAAGRFDSTLIVVTSDHGHMLGEHRTFKHQAEIWQGLVGVPLVIKLPGQTRGSVCDEPVETADLALLLPALCELALSTELPHWAGARSFVPPPLGPFSVDPDDPLPPCPLPGRSALAISEAARMGELAEKYPWRWDKSYLSIRDGALKFVIDSTGLRRVADLAADPGETLRELTPAENARCSELVEAWLAGLIERPEGVDSLDAAEAERRARALRAQGYVGD